MSGMTEVAEFREADAPLLAFEDVEVHYQDTSYLEEVLPETVLERFGVDPDEPVRAVDGVSLGLEENDVLAVVGESGCGKTTLGKTAVGLQEPTGGSVNYRGHDIWDLKAGTADVNVHFEKVRRRLQIVHQDPGSALNPYRKVMANLSEPLKRWNPDLNLADRHERIIGLLDQVGVTPAADYAQRYPHQLSGGEQQRIALVRAMLMNPDVVLADEAVSALDVSLRVEIMDLMLELQDEFDTSFIFISHNLANARYLARRPGSKIAVMYLGQIVEVGPAQEVIRNPDHPYTKLLKWATAELNPAMTTEGMHEEPPLSSIDVPDPTDPPAGCRFHTRCPAAREVCRDTIPELFGTEGDRRAACFRMVENHDYWDSQPLPGTADIDLPE